jgi:hypothetical protein
MAIAVLAETEVGGALVGILVGGVLRARRLLGAKDATSAAASQPAVPGSLDSKQHGRRPELLLSIGEDGLPLIAAWVVPIKTPCHLLFVAVSRSAILSYLLCGRAPRVTSS